MAAIMVADDDLDMRLLVRMVIEMAGWEIVAEAADGAEAIETWRALSGPARPDVVVLDNRLPGIDGVEAGRLILEERPEQAVILYSAFLDDDLRREAARAGISAYVSKADLQTLPSIIRGLMTAGRVASSPTRRRLCPSDLGQGSGDERG